MQIRTVAAQHLLTPCGADWNEVTVIRRRGDATASVAVSDEAATFPLVDGGTLTLHRRDPTAEFVTPHPLDDEELIHPYLAPVGAVFARWAGRESLHAGAFTANGRAWGVLGSREAGKSTLLAALHAAGHGIVTDDVLVIDDGQALAGPRAIDLRAGAAEAVGLDEEADPVRQRTRWRVRLPPIVPELPLAGWIVLDWGADVELRLLPLAERFGPLAAQRSARLPGEDPLGLLDLIRLPVWQLRRPREWSVLDVVVERLATLTSSD